MSTSTSAATFPALVSTVLRSDASRPLVTFYDDATGERVELSVATYANWVDKTAGLVLEELEVTRGGLVLLDLPTHWLGAVWLGAAWTVGLCVTTDPELAGNADLVVCGPDGFDAYAAEAEGSAGPLADRAVVAISLRPLGGRFVQTLPSGVVDYGAVVLAQPDTFVGYDPPCGDDAAWRAGGRSLSQTDLLASVAQRPVVGRKGRLLTDVNPCGPLGPATLLSALARDAATIWVANPDESSWQHRYDVERATAELRAPRSA